MANMAYAFDTVLDRAIEAEKKVAVLEDRNRSGDHQAEILRRDLNNAQLHLTTAKVALKKFEDAEHVFAALYEAVEKTLPVLTEKDINDPFAVRLRETMGAAKKFIDPIPF